MSIYDDSRGIPVKKYFAEVESSKNFAGPYQIDNSVIRDLDALRSLSLPVSLSVENFTVPEDGRIEMRESYFLPDTNERVDVWIVLKSAKSETQVMDLTVQSPDGDHSDGLKKIIEKHSFSPVMYPHGQEL